MHRENICCCVASWLALAGWHDAKQAIFGIPIPTKLYTITAEEVDNLYSD